MKRRLFGVIPLWLALVLGVTVTAVAAYLLLAQLAFTGTSLPGPDVTVTTPWACVRSAGDYGDCAVTGADGLTPSFAFTGYDNDAAFTVTGTIENDMPGGETLVIACDETDLAAAPPVSAVTDNATWCGNFLGATDVAAFSWTVEMGDATAGTSFSAPAGIEVTFENAP